MNNCTTPVGPNDILHRTHPARVGHREHHADLLTHVDVGHVFRSPGPIVRPVPAAPPVSANIQVGSGVSPGLSALVPAGSGTSQHPQNTLGCPAYDEDSDCPCAQSDADVVPEVSDRPRSDVDPAARRVKPVRSLLATLNRIELTDRDQEIVERIAAWNMTAIEWLRNVLDGPSTTGMLDGRK
jgi:hypothetical protein